MGSHKGEQVATKITLKKRKTPKILKTKQRINLQKQKNTHVEKQDVKKIK